MKINVLADGFSLTEGISNFTKERASVSLGKFEDKIAQIDIRLTDINGPKGGEDKRCRLVIKSDSQPLIVIEETTVDLYESISLCFIRAKQTASRQFKRTHSKHLKKNNLLKRNMSIV